MRGKMIISSARRNFFRKENNKKKLVVLLLFEQKFLNKSFWDNGYYADHNFGVNGRTMMLHEIMFTFWAEFDNSFYIHTLKEDPNFKFV